MNNTKNSLFQVNFTEIDAYTAPEFEDGIQRTISNKDFVPPLVVDLSSVEYMDCSALGILIGARNQMIANSQEARICLKSARPVVQKVIKICKLDHVFECTN